MKNPLNTCHMLMTHTGMLGVGMLPYAWSKRSLLELGEGLAAEMDERRRRGQPAVHVSVICPGVVTTDMALAATRATMGEETHKTALQHRLSQLGAVTAAQAAEEIHAGLMQRHRLIAFPASAVRTMRWLEALPKGLLAHLVRHGIQRNRQRCGRGKEHAAPAAGAAATSAGSALQPSAAGVGVAAHAQPHGEPACVEAPQAGGQLCSEAKLDPKAATSTLELVYAEAVSTGRDSSSSGVLSLA